MNIFIQPVGSSQGLATLAGRGFTYSDNQRTIPQVQQFSVGIQRELPGRLALDVAVDDIGDRTYALRPDVVATVLDHGALLLDLESKHVLEAIERFVKRNQGDAAASPSA